MITRNRKYGPRHVICVLGCALSTLGTTGCGDGDSNNGTTPTDPSYADFVARGWTAFTAGDYTDAEGHFQDAVDLDAARADGHSGLGWTSLRMDDPASADLSFAAGSTGAGDTAVLADMFAGWAFASNALKDPAGVDLTNYSQSNAHAAAALDVDTDWSFTHGPGLDRGDLVVLRAENFFALGEFAESLTEVQLLDPIFSVDVGTPGGQAALAEQIELLKEQEGRLASTPQERPQHPAQERPVHREAGTQDPGHGQDPVRR
jgi:hypothetical protein